METETWIERLLIDQLTTHDRRYKYDYAGIEQTTDDLVMAWTKLDSITAGDEPEWPSFEQLLSVDAALESEVETTLQTLQERGLIERVGEQDRPGPPFEPGDYGTTTVWRPTVDGRAEARAIREPYSARWTHSWNRTVRSQTSSARKSSQSPEHMVSFHATFDTDGLQESDPRFL